MKTQTTKLSPELRMEMAGQLEKHFSTEASKKLLKKTKRLAKDAYRKRNERIWATIRHEVERDILAI